MWNRWRFIFAKKITRAERNAIIRTSPSPHVICNLLTVFSINNSPQLLCRKQSTLQQLYFNLALVKSSYIFSLQNCLTQLSFWRQAFVRYSAGLQAAVMLLSNHIQRYFDSWQDQPSAVVFQLSCSVQPAVLSCSFTTQRNCLRSCLLSSMISLISNGSYCKVLY